MFKKQTNISGKVETELKESIDYSEFVFYNETHLQIRDYKKKLSVLPNDFFEQFSDATTLDLNAMALIEIPTSILALKKLKRISFLGGKYKSLPDLSELHLLESISIDRNNQINLDKDIAKIKHLPNLLHFKLGSYRGKKFPSVLSELKTLKHLVLGYGLEKKKDMDGLVSVVKKMPWLESLNIDFNLNPEDIQPNFLELDFLNYLNFRSYFSEDKTPLCLGLTRHVEFKENKRLNDLVTSFRHKYINSELSNDTKQTLFCFYKKNFLELKDILPDKLDSALESNEITGIVLLTKVKGFTKKKWAELLNDTCFYLADESDKENKVFVVGSETEYNDFEKLIISNKNVVFKDHLQDLIVKLEDPWLLQDDNAGLNDQLLKLLSSNLDENYKIAFEIIEGGGANKTIQSLLAAIMTTHPDKKIAKKATKLYEKYGSQLFVQHAKVGVSGSLRKSGSTQHKLAHLLNHPEIDEFVFRFMHHAIATSNRNIKDVLHNVFEVKKNTIKVIPEEIKYFNQIQTLRFYSCPNLDLNSAIPHFKEMASLKHLVLNGSHLTIPRSVGELVHIESLEAEQNEFEDVSELKKLENLKTLNVAGCKLVDLSWLSSLKNLKSLNLSSNKITQLPKELEELKQLTEIHIKQNKLSKMDTGLLSLPYLKLIDYSNNLIKEIDYNFFKHKLEVLLLRSNKIASFDIQEFEKHNITTVSLKKLNFASNQIAAFNLGDVNFFQLGSLDISKNKIKELHSSVFLKTRVHEFFASNNQIEDIPDSVIKRPYFTKFWIQNNKIKELRESFAKIRIDNADLSNNEIEKMHSDFFIKKEKDYSRLYWKIKNNPISIELKGASGLYGR
ncbi:leucine-rich repeat domain-containing protein [Maribacter sp. Asnod1-A12]|uniref:leucine-rich repeat domain-containing protein n=1 Tax=Maribacter sp. Asnod1-A12 TaxID=3160576 RepID=UPI003870674D